MGTAQHENNTVSVGFSRVVESAPDTARAAVLYGSGSPRVPIAEQVDSRERDPYKEKRTLPGALADVSDFVCVAARDPLRGPSPWLGSGILTRFPFDRVRASVVS